MKYIRKIIYQVRFNKLAIEGELAVLNKKTEEITLRKRLFQQLKTKDIGIFTGFWKSLKVFLLHQALAPDTFPVGYLA